MNIVTPIPTSINFVNANVNTEAARRDNVQRETIPQTSGLENSAAETGLGSESDRVKTPGKPPQPVTYEKPQAQQPADAGQQNLDKDNSQDASAGKENAESRQQEQQQQAEQQKVRQLQSRDKEVKAHEQAHAARGGQYAGAPQYEYERGPDGRQYAVSGEVSIDISEENTPEETLRKMQQVRAAALAPAEPSPQDLRVAQEATQKANEARSEVNQQSAEQVSASFARVFPKNPAADTAQSDAPQLDEIVKDPKISPPKRSLSDLESSQATDIDSQRVQQQLNSRDQNILRRAAVIENFYQNISQPRNIALEQSA